MTSLFWLYIMTTDLKNADTSSFESVVLKTLTRILERDLAALLFGAAVMLVVLFKYWNVPKKWEALNDRIQRIEKRQKKFYPLLLEQISKGYKYDFDDIEDGEDDEDDE
jgi:hypothetical protein